MAGRSCCDHCGAVLRPRDLVPLVSYFVRRGRAFCCGGRIDPLHPVAELLGAVAGGLGLALGGWPALVFGLLLLALALFDARDLWLPDPVVTLLAITGLVLGPPPLGDRMIGMAGGWLSLTGIGLAYRWLRGREGLGGGDPKMLAAIGAWMGWVPLPMVMLLAALTGLAVAAVLRLAGRAIDGATHLPLGTLMAFATWLLWLWERI